MTAAAILRTLGLASCSDRFLVDYLIRKHRRSS